MINGSCSILLHYRVMFVLHCAAERLCMYVFVPHLCIVSFTFYLSDYANSVTQLPFVDLACKNKEFNSCYRSSNISGRHCLQVRLWGPPNFLPTGYRQLFPRVRSSGNVKLTNHLNIVKGKRKVVPVIK
jgi:hypothetical protein